MSNNEQRESASYPEEGSNNPVIENTVQVDKQNLVFQSNKIAAGSLLAKQTKPVFLEIEGEKLELPNQAVVVLGRVISEAVHEQPDVALNQFGATEKGVSRRHARIARYSNLLCITDLGSSNGTFVNGERLIKNDTRILHNGDELQLSFLKLKVEF